MTDVHAEFERLLADQLDGPADVARDRRLNALLRSHPDLQEEYLDQVRLHALLHWCTGQAATEEPVPRRAAGRPQFQRARLALAAALVLLAVGLGALGPVGAPEAQAAPVDVVERLVDWNLAIAQAPSSAERKRLHAEQADRFRGALARAKLPPAERELAETLLENASWLADNDDPVAAAERFDAIADRLVTHMDGRVRAKDEKRLARLAETYRKVSQQLAVYPNITRAAESGALDFERKRKLERAILNDAGRAERLEELLERAPDASRKEIRKALKDRPKPNKRTGVPGN
jgi:hypothetical protein